MRRPWFWWLIGVACATGGVAVALYFFARGVPHAGEEARVPEVYGTAVTNDAATRATGDAAAVEEAPPARTGTAQPERREREARMPQQSGTAAPRAPAAEDSMSRAPSERMVSLIPHLTAKECAAYRNRFWLYPEPEAQVIAAERRLRTDDPEKASLLRAIACIPQVTWLVGGDREALARKARETVAAAAAVEKIPVLVVYHTPDSRRAYWHTLAAQEEYPNVIGAIARAVGPYRAWIILEPDALPLSFSYEPSARRVRLAQLREALALFRRYAPRAKVYVDAGHSNWLSAAQVVALLREGGLEDADGVSINVSNFYTTASQLRYGEEIVALWGEGKTFIIDTGRNGRGAPEDGTWCNPPGRALGAPPALVPAHPSLDAVLWIKPPGESDGFCNGGPPPGKFWLDYALALVRNRMEDAISAP